MIDLDAFKTLAHNPIISQYNEAKTRIAETCADFLCGENFKKNSNKNAKTNYGKILRLLYKHDDILIRLYEYIVSGTAEKPALPVTDIINEARVHEFNLYDYIHKHYNGIFTDNFLKDLFLLDVSGSRRSGNSEFFILTLFKDSKFTNNKDGGDLSVESYMLEAKGPAAPGFSNSSVISDPSDYNKTEGYLPKMQQNIIKKYFRPFMSDIFPDIDIDYKHFDIRPAANGHRYNGDNKKNTRNLLDIINNDLVYYYNEYKPCDEKEFFSRLQDLYISIMVAMHNSNCNRSRA